MIIKKLGQLTGHNAAIFGLVQGADERHVYTGAGDGWVVHWDLDDPALGKLVAKVEVQVFSLCYLKQEQKIVAGDMNGGLHWIDLANPASTKNIAHHQRGVFDILAVDSHVFTLGGDGKLSRWSRQEMRATETYQLANQSLRSLDYSPGRRELAVGGSDGAIYLLDLETLELRQTIQAAHGSSVFALRYSPNGSHLLSGGRDAILNVWDLENKGEKISSQPAHWFTINSIAFSPDGSLFATGSRDKTIKIWDSNSYELLKVLEGGRDGGHFHSVNKVLWAKNGACLVACSDDRTASIWGLGTD
jgi:WD40 repeat protein